MGGGQLVYATIECCPGSARHTLNIPYLLLSYVSGRTIYVECVFSREGRAKSHYDDLLLCGQHVGF
jgi:hypothetical protein